MNILLLRSDTHNYATPPPDTPIGLMYVASSLRKQGHDVILRDLDVESLGDLSEFDAVGISILSKARQNAFKTIRQIKDKWPEIRLVAGGPHVSSMPKQILDTLPVDAVVIGEGESAAVDAFESTERKIFWDKLCDIDILPLPAFDLIDFDRYYMQIAHSNPNWVIDGMRLGDLKYSNIVASRGCPGRCVFCNAWKNWGLKIRKRSAVNVVDELELLNKEYGIELFAFNDNCFPSSKKQGMAVCGEIQRRGLKILWKCDTRGDVIDDELAVEMRRAGCFMPALGIESGSPQILENINKRLDLDMARESLLSIKRAGMLCYTLLMIGNPGESNETIQETVDYINTINPNYATWVTGVMVLPDTKLCEMAGTEDAFWAEGNDLPFYTKEHTMEELTDFSNILQGIQKSEIPMELVTQ